MKFKALIFSCALLMLTANTWAVCDREMEEHLRAAPHYNCGTEACNSAMQRARHVHTTIFPTIVLSSPEAVEKAKNNLKIAEQELRKVLATPQQYSNATELIAKHKFNACSLNYTLNLTASKENPAQSQEAQSNTQQAQTSNNQRGHDPAGAANECVRVNTGNYAGYTNICNQRISVIHCLAGNYNKGATDAWAFGCDRPGGLWANSSTAGKIAPGRTEHTATPEGATVYYFACRDPYSLEGVAFVGGGLVGRCVRQP